jgi:hypothetical protein
MSNSTITIPSIISSVLLGMIAYKVYSKNEEKNKEHFVNFPSTIKSSQKEQKNYMNVAKSNITYTVDTTGPAVVEASNVFPVPTEEVQVPFPESVELPISVDGTIPLSVDQIYNVDQRTLSKSHAALRDRQLEGADVVRGDLSIEIESPCGRFGYTTERKSALHGGMLNFGVTDPNEKKQESFLQTTTRRG